MENQVDSIEKEIQELKDLWQQEHDVCNSQFQILGAKLSEISAFRKMMTALRERLAAQEEPTTMSWQVKELQTIQIKPKSTI